MKYRELSKDEFMKISYALELAAKDFRQRDKLTVATDCDELRKLFESAHTTWFELEDMT